MTTPGKTKRLRVLQAITHLALGGAERVAFNLIGAMRDRCDFGVYVANGVDAGPVGQSMTQELRDMNVPLYVGTSVPIKFGGMALAGWWFGKAVKQFKPDIIHLHTEIPESSFAAMVSLRPSTMRIPLVRTIHNSIYWNPWRKLGIWSDRKMARSFVAGVAEGAVMAFEALRAESGAGAPPRPPVLIYNGVVVKDAPRPLDKPPGDPVRILFAGRFEDQKGADLLPQILRQVQLPPAIRCSLDIFGSGTHEAALRSLASSPPAGWTIQISGPVPNLSGRMPTYDLMIMPSRYEGLALSAIEAALLAVPIVATDGPGIREGFPRDYPWLAKAGDAVDFAALLQQALHAPATWANTVQMAQEFARAHFNVATMCDAYNRLYADATGAEARRGDAPRNAV
jgi:glycosyltransferase involved in cell wall biosynthesis